MNAQPRGEGPRRLPLQHRLVRLVPPSPVVVRHVDPRTLGSVVELSHPSELR